ncbi:WD40 repeat domain-containing protein [Bacteroidetes/Chlorobi group bacterium ChocPot_Mid]|jgi:hypothetical protein|nr:MAG: WD40 repeat domain-containing protein [Bacteroidetes/Chlorobi group bacterium ChocPot_Mid]
MINLIMLKITKTNKYKIRCLFFIVLILFATELTGQQHCYDYLLLDGSEQLVTFGMDTTKNWWAITEPFSGNYRLTINGIAQKDYKEIRQLTFSPDGNHWAYFSRDNSQWYLNTNDTIIPLPGSDVGQIDYSPNSQKMAYSYFEGYDEIIIIGEKRFREYQRDFKSNPTIYLSQNAEKYAWVVKRGSGFALNISGKETNVFDEILPIGFWYDGKMLYACRSFNLWEIYKGNELISSNYSQVFEASINLKGNVAAVLVAQTGKQFAVLISDEYYEPLTGNRYDYVSNLILHPYLPMIAYNANLYQNNLVVLNSTEFAGGKEQTGTPEFTYDGEELFFIGCDLHCFVNINGRKYPLNNEVSLDRYYAKKPGSNTIAYVTNTSMIVRDFEKEQLYSGMMVDNLVSPRYNWRNGVYEALGSINNRLYLLTCRF